MSSCHTSRLERRNAPPLPYFSHLASSAASQQQPARAVFVGALWRHGKLQGRIAGVIFAEGMIMKTKGCGNLKKHDDGGGYRVFFDA